MAQRRSKYTGNTHCFVRLLGLSLFYLFSRVSCSQVTVPERINAVQGKNITLSCRIEVGSNLSLTQSSWERRLPSGTATVAVFNPEYGTSVTADYSHRVSFVSPSVRDATIVLQGVGLDDVGSYSCKVATFPLGNTQASTYVNVLVEPKVYVSAGPSALLDGANESLVATCIAERGLPEAEVFWETQLLGRSEQQRVVEADGTTSVQLHYRWGPQSQGQGQLLTCVVLHPALQSDFRIPYTVSVHFAPVVWVQGVAVNWFLGQENVKFECGAKANPAPRSYTWIRLDGVMPDGVCVLNNTLEFTRALQKNDSGVYRCEVINDIGLRSKDVNLWVQEPPPTTAPPPTTVAPLTSGAGTAQDRRRGPLPSASSTAAMLPPQSSTLGTVVGGAVGGLLLLLLLLILGAACFMRRKRTFRGDYYTKQYLGPNDMQKEAQKEAQLDVLQPQLMQEVYGDKSSKGSQDLKPKLTSDIYPEYKDEWADRGDQQRSLKDPNYYPNNHYNSHNLHPSGPPVHGGGTGNGSPYAPPDDRYGNDNPVDSDYVSHMDGSVISRREWYV